MREKMRLSALKQTTVVKVDKQQKKKERLSRATSAKSKFGRRLLQAGFELPSNVYCTFALGISLTLGLLAYNLGLVLAAFLSAATFHYLIFGYLDERALKRTRKVIPQLAPFIDGIASALSTGFNIEGAVVQATEGIPQGLLRTEMDRVVNALNKGFTLRESMAVLKERIQGKEVTSLIVALMLFSSMGGTVLEPFRRLSRKIREQQGVIEKASRDLVMVKQAFNILLVIALGLPGLLFALVPDYMQQAFEDSLGRIVIQFGAVLILSAVLFFKKITTLRI